jgi:hypothetical protein
MENHQKLSEIARNRQNLFQTFVAKENIFFFWKKARGPEIAEMY